MEKRKGLTLSINEQYEQEAMTDFDSMMSLALFHAEYLPRQKTIQRLNSMVDYSTTDQEKLGFAFLTPEGGQRIAERFGFDLFLADHHDPELSAKIRKLYTENWGASFSGDVPQNGGFIYRAGAAEDLIWLRTFQGNIASAIYFHEIGHLLSFRLVDRDEIAFCEKLSAITRHFPRSYLDDLMESYAWCLGTCMAAHIDRLCSKSGPSLYARDCVMAVAIESGHDIQERISFRYFAAFLQKVESKIHWHVARKPFMDTVRATEKMFMNEFVNTY